MIEVDRTPMQDDRIDLVRMMEKAGRCLASLARDRFLDGSPVGKRVTVLAGGGNGDSACPALSRQRRSQRRVVDHYRRIEITCQFYQGPDLRCRCHRRVQRSDPGHRLPRYARLSYQQLPGEHRDRTLIMKLVHKVSAFARSLAI